MTDRRPIASRQTGWARWMTGALASKGITPNQISLASIGFAALAGLMFYFAVQAEAAITRGILLISGALFCQLRLVCNLVDGMVAVEARQAAPDGAFWNEAPDRVSDILILAGLGLGLGLPALGWAAAALAIATAYIRELGRATTGHNDFSGPMAKPHRMAVLTIAAGLAALVALWGRDGQGVMTAALWIVVVGAALTCLRRSAALITRMNS